MERYLIQLPAGTTQSPIEDGGTQSLRKVQFTSAEPETAIRKQRSVIIPDPSQYLDDWPLPPTVPVATSSGDPFPLFFPGKARYFDERDTGHVHHDHEDLPGTPTSLACAGDANHAHSHASALLNKRYSYTRNGTIKDAFFLFKSLPTDEEYVDISLPDRINRQLLGSVSQKASSAPSADNVEGEIEGWTEDEHSPQYWNQRMREVDFFVKNSMWSLDPIGDWSYLNQHTVPKHFLRKIRRYFEVRPLEFLRDTGSYKMFHVVNQFADLEKASESKNGRFKKAINWMKMAAAGQLTPLKRARKMELDYQAMIWLSIWDPQLKANVFQLNEATMSDWCFTWADWRTAIGVENLLTKNERHAFDSLWDNRPARTHDDEDEPEAEEVDEWLAEDEEESGVAESTT